MAVASIVLTCACVDSLAQEGKRPAHFVITDKVVNPDLQPFTATIGGIGNSFINDAAGFEPQVFRDRYFASQDAPDRVYVPPKVLSMYDTFREGMLDGASVFVYRIANGRFVKVRESRVATKGHHMSGWLPIVSSKSVVDPSTRNFRYRWAPWNRPDVPSYFTVRAIDVDGNLSPPAKAFAVRRPSKTDKGRPKNTTKRFHPRRGRRDDKSAAGPPQPARQGRPRRRASSRVGCGESLGSRRLYGVPVGLFARSTSGVLSSAERQGERAPISTSRLGDMVIVSKKFYDSSRERYFSNRVWDAGNANGLLRPEILQKLPYGDPDGRWVLAKHGDDRSVDEGGETFLRLELTNDKRVMLGKYNYAGTDQDWYDVLEAVPYRVEVWLRKKGQGRVRFGVSGFFAKKPHRIEPIEFKPGPTWQKFSATFKPSVVQAPKRPGMMYLEIKGTGTFDVDNFRIYRADTPYLDFTKREYARLKASGMGALRTHGFIKTARATMDMEQLTNPGGVINDTGHLNTLPQTLAVIRKAKMRPWLQLEPHMSDAEWLGFVEYMAAPYDPKRDRPRDKPWAYKRFMQGQAKPWIEEFDQVWFEIGNETWNNLFRPWVFYGMDDSVTEKHYTGGKVYGLFQEYVRSVMKKSPYWDSARLDDRLVFILGGWNGKNYGAHAASVSPSSRYMTVAGYNGGWDEGEGPPRLDSASMFNVLNQVSQSAIPRAAEHRTEAQELSRGRRRKVRTGTYEAGPGYALNGLNNAKVTKEQSLEQEKVMKSLAAGTATLDCFLARAYLGFETQNFFTFKEGIRWSSHAKWYNGGQAYPSWALLSLFNNEGRGDMLATETRSVPRIDLKPFRRRNAVDDAPLVAAYATRKGRRYNVFLVSRRVPGYPDGAGPGYTPVTLDLPFKSVDAMRVYRLSGDPASNNIYREDAAIEQIKLNAKGFKPKFVVDRTTGADDRGLPPASTFLYVFEGAR